MPRFPDQAETANNRDAESGLQKPASIPMTNTGSGNANGLQVGDAPTPNATMHGLSDAQWLQMTLNMKSAAEQNLNGLRNIWATNYRAINNQHAASSKYNSDKYRGRSQLHRPKTRTAVKKADAGAANALFATSDVVSIEAANPLDPKQQASAEINKALLNIRLDRKSGKAGVPWFQIAVGAHNDSLATGICVSKQYWEHREISTGETEQVPVMDSAGQPVTEPVLDPLTKTPQMDPATGQPQMKPTLKTQPKMKVVRDRPMIRLFPPDLVLRDPGADWLDQVQESSYIGLMHPVTIGDFEALSNDRQTKTTNMKFRKVERSMLMGARIGSGSQTVNSGRESGNGNQQREQISTGLQEFDRIWLIEWFVRYQGREYVYWTAGSSVLASDVMPLEQAYPEQKGERPIVIGVGNLEPHKIDPMSMVQSIIPLQMEMNEIVNMRMDGVKDSIRPLAMVKRGKNIDVKAIQHRSGDSALYVTDKDDVSFDRPGEVGQSAYVEMNYLNSDFDDATGQFNGGSVTTNRELGKTVGGLNLLNSNANIVGDFDLRVWIETYVEPVLRQVVKLEQWYEDDEVLLQVAGQKAKLYQKFNVTVIDDELLGRELNVSVNAGIGNSDPMVKFDKFIKAGAAAGQFIGDQAQARINQDAVINELFGAAGFRDAAERFFHPGDQTDQRITQLQQAAQSLQGQLDDKAADRSNALELARLNSATQLAVEFFKGIQLEEAAKTAAITNAQTLGITHAHDQFTAQQGQAHDMASTLQGQAHDVATTTLGQAHDTAKTATAQAHDLAKTKLVGDQKAALPTKTGAKAPPAAAPAATTGPEAANMLQGDMVESQLGNFTQMFMKSILPSLGMGGGSPPAPGQPPAQPQMPAQSSAGPPAAAPSPMDNMMPMLMQMMQQQQAALNTIAQAVATMAHAQAAPRTSKKNPDGSITMIAGGPPMTMQ